MLNDDFEDWRARDDREEKALASLTRWMKAVAVIGMVLLTALTAAEIYKAFS